MIEKLNLTIEDHWSDTIMSSFFIALVPTAALSATTHDLWAIGVSFAGTFGGAVLQHRRQLPQRPWTDEERAAKLQKEST